MEAKDSKVGSYAWQSILQGRDVIQRGSRWRVGDGREIKIWQHHWLPIKHPTVVASPIIETMEDATVNMLIDPLTRQWDESLIDGIFIPHEAEKIKKIPFGSGEGRRCSVLAFLTGWKLQLQVRISISKGKGKFSHDRGVCKPR